MKNTKVALIVIAIITILYLVPWALEDRGLINLEISKTSYTSEFNIIASQENEDLEEVIQNYARTKNYNVNIEYAGTIDIMDKLNSGEKYDAVWISNSIWLYMLDSDVKVSNSKYTSVNPIVFGIKKSKAKS